jgi:hypothetical protein
VTRRFALNTVVIPVIALLATACIGIAGAPVGTPPVVVENGTVAPVAGAATVIVPTPPDASAATVALEGTVYGEGVTLTESTPISQILDNVDAYVGKRVRVEGLVTSVCEMRGCWIELAGDREYETFRVKVDDGVIVFPVEVNGQYAVAEGLVAQVDAAQQEAERQAERQGEGAGEDMGEGSGEGGLHVGEGGTVVRLNGTGAVIRAQR